jgi:hypothetical protein
MDSNSRSRDDGITIRDAPFDLLAGGPGVRRPTNGREEQAEFGASASPTARSKPQPTCSLKNCAAFRHSPSAPRRSCSTTPRTRHCRSQSSSKAKPTVACAAPMISEKASKPSKPNASQTSAEAERGGEYLGCRPLSREWMPPRCVARAFASPYRVSKMRVKTFAPEGKMPGLARAMTWGAIVEDDRATGFTGGGAKFLSQPAGLRSVKLIMPGAGQCQRVDRGAVIWSAPRSHRSGAP